MPKTRTLGSRGELSGEKYFCSDRDQTFPDIDIHHKGSETARFDLISSSPGSPSRGYAPSRTQARHTALRLAIRRRSRRLRVACPRAANRPALTPTSGASRASAGGKRSRQTRPVLGRHARVGDPVATSRKMMIWVEIYIRLFSCPACPGHHCEHTETSPGVCSGWEGSRRPITARVPGAGEASSKNGRERPHPRLARRSSSSTTRPSARKNSPQLPVTGGSTHKRNEPAK